MHSLKLSSVLLLALVLVACAAEPKPADPMAGMDHSKMNMDPPENETMSVMSMTTDDEILFHVMNENGGVFTEYGVSHTKEMHLIVVRDDLRHFYHLHPARDAAGNWSVAFTPEAGGIYRFYADFADKDMQAHLLTFEREYSGEKGEYGIVRDEAVTRVINGVTYTLSATTFEGRRLQLNYEAVDAAGKPVVFGEYLGEKGHVVLLAPDGEYIHTHPLKDYVGYNENNPPVFTTPNLMSRFYRIYAQFNINNEIVTVPFDWGAYAAN